MRNILDELVLTDESGSYISATELSWKPVGLEGGEGVGLLLEAQEILHIPKEGLFCGEGEFLLLALDTYGDFSLDILRDDEGLTYLRDEDVLEDGEDDDDQTFGSRGRADEDEDDEDDCDELPDGEDDEDYDEDEDDDEDGVEHSSVFGAVSRDHDDD